MFNKYFFLLIGIFSFNCDNSKKIASNQCENYQEETLIIDRKDITIEVLIDQYHNYCLKHKKSLNARLKIDSYSYNTDLIKKEDLIKELKNNKNIEAVQENNQINKRN